MLRALLWRALEESGARDTPALVDLVIESAGEPRLRIELSNGYRASAPLPPHDCFAFCEQHSVWEIEGFRRALLSEARLVYGEILQERAALRPTEAPTAAPIAPSPENHTIREEAVMRERRQTWI